MSDSTTQRASDVTDTRSGVTDTSSGVTDTRVGRYGLLLAALLLILILRPFLSAQLQDLHAMALTLGIVLLAGVFSVAPRRRHVIVAALLAVPVFVGASLSVFSAVPGANSVALASAAVFLGYVAAAILVSVLEEDRVSLDTILGGICVYLLVGLAFLMAFAFLEWTHAGTFLLNGETFDRPTTYHPQLIYFSFVTLTTLGFGDVVPTTPAAQMLCAAEAILGQVYLVVFVARLVGLHIHERGQGSDVSGL